MIMYLFLSVVGCGTITMQPGCLFFSVCASAVHCAISGRLFYYFEVYALGQKRRPVTTWQAALQCCTLAYPFFWDVPVTFLPATLVVVWDSAPFFVGDFNHTVCPLPFFWPQACEANCLFSLICTLFGLTLMLCLAFICRVLQTDAYCRLCGPCNIWQMPASINASIASTVVVAPSRGGLP